MLHVDATYVTSILQELVRIDSVNPSICPGGAGETAIATFVAEQLAQMGLTVHVHDRVSGRPSVVGILKGSGGGRSLMLNAHIDTVGVDEMAEPFSGAIQNGRLFGRGSYDMKGGLAACLGAARALADAQVPVMGDVLIAAVADEEYASIGIQEVLEHHLVDGAVVTEPTELDICLAHKGFIWLEVAVRGRAAHGSRFDLGLDANLRMGRFLNQLDALERALRARSPHPLVGPPSLHAATLRGGTGLSTYAAHCTLQIERRTVPGEHTAEVISEIEQVLEAIRRNDATFDAELSTLLVRDPFEVRSDAAIVQSLATASKQVLGVSPKFVGQNPWMDAAFLSTAGVETVVMGAAGHGAHAKEEWVDVQSVVTLAKSLALAAVSYCGAATSQVEEAWTTNV